MRANPRPTVPVPTAPLGGSGYRDETVVEYDLDNDDEDWLEKYNLGATKLTWVTARRGKEGGKAPGRFDSRWQIEGRL
jgi:hypothetical protein